MLLNRIYGFQIWNEPEMLLEICERSTASFSLISTEASWP